MILAKSVSVMSSYAVIIKEGREMTVYKVTDWKTCKSFYVKQCDLHYFTIRDYRYSFYKHWIY